LLAVVALMVAGVGPVYAEDSAQSSYGASEMIPFNPNDKAHVAMQEKLQAEADAQAAAWKSDMINKAAAEKRAFLLDGELVGDPAAIQRIQEQDAHTWVDPVTGVHETFNVDGRYVSPAEWDAESAKSQREFIKHFREERKRMKAEQATKEQEAAQDIEDAKAEQIYQQREAERIAQRERLERMRPKVLRSGEGTN
jgi:hypothetical protein